MISCYTGDYTTGDHISCFHVEGREKYKAISLRLEELNIRGMNFFLKVFLDRYSTNLAIVPNCYLNKNCNVFCKPV